MVGSCTLRAQSHESSGGTNQLCDPAIQGRLEVLQLTSRVFGNTRNLRVWIPPDYDDPANATQRYPILYMLDGQALFGRCSGTTSNLNWYIDRALFELISKKAIQPIFVVGIDNTGPKRDYEYAAYTNSLRLDDPGETHPRGDQFPDFLATDVMPLIEGKYRIAKGRAHTGIGGSSAGAVAALYTLVHRPDLAGLGLLESTSLQYGNGQLVRDTLPLAVGPIRISIGIGTAEMGPDIPAAIGMPDSNAGFVSLSKTLADHMQQALFNHPEVKLTIQPSGYHNAQYWGERFPAAAQFLFPPGAR